MKILLYIGQGILLLQQIHVRRSHQMIIHLIAPFSESVPVPADWSKKRGAYMRIYYHVCCLPVYRISSTKKLLRLFLIHMHPVHQFPVIQIQIPVYGIVSLIKFMVFPCPVQ